MGQALRRKRIKSLDDAIKELDVASNEGGQRLRRVIKQDIKRLGKIFVNDRAAESQPVHRISGKTYHLIQVSKHHDEDEGLTSIRSVVIRYPWSSLLVATLGALFAGFISQRIKGK